MHLVEEIRRKERNIAERAALEKLAAEERQREIKSSLLEIAAKKKRRPFSSLRKMRLPPAMRKKKQKLKTTSTERQTRVDSGNLPGGDEAKGDNDDLPGTDDHLQRVQRDYEQAYNAVNQDDKLSAREKLMRRSSFAEEEVVTSNYAMFFGGADRPQGTFQENPADRQTLLRLHSEDAVRYEADLDRRLWLSVNGASRRSKSRGSGGGGRGGGRRRSSRNRDRPWTSEAARRNKSKGDEKMDKGKKKKYRKPAPSIEKLLSQDLKPLFRTRRATSASARARKRSATNPRVRILEKQIGRALKGRGSKEWTFLINSWGKSSPRLRNGSVDTSEMASEDMLPLPLSEKIEL